MRQQRNRRAAAGLLAAALLGAAPARAQSAPVTAPDSQQVRRVRVLPVPALGYAPETGLYGGAVALLTLQLHPRATTRVSNAKVEVNYTLRRQLILEAGWNYFSDQEKYFSRGTAHFSRYPDLYYGVGADAPAAAEAHYGSDRAVLRVEVLRRLHPTRPVFVGPQLRYTQYRRIRYLDETEPRFAELTPSQSVGGGLTLLCDTRSNLLNPTAGFYGELGASQNYAAGRSYQRLTLDARLYRSWRGWVGATQLTSTVLPGRVPFYDYALLGGAAARGYYYGRFRGPALTTWQGELRTPQWRRLGLAGFGGLAQLSRRGAWLDGAGLKPSGGAGLRWLADRKERINLRLDYAWGAHGQTGFYVAFGESF